MAQPSVATRPAESWAPGLETIATDRWAGRAIGALRILMGLLWLQNAGWKHPPFTTHSGVGRYVQLGIDNPVFSPYSWISKHVIIPNLTAFGWGVAIIETALAVFLLLGLATRLWATIGALQAVAITLSALHAPHEWGWSYWMLIGIHVVLVATAAGRTYGLDAVLRPVWRERTGRVSQLLMKVS